jgi:hypothetical protein
MMIQKTINTDSQESIHQHAQKLVSRFADRESIGETAQDLVLEIIGEGKGRQFHRSRVLSGGLGNPGRSTSQ